MKPRRSTRPDGARLAALFLPSLLAVITHGGVAEWTGASGLLPQELPTPWTLVDEASPEDPTLTEGVMTLTGSAQSELMLYAQIGTVLEMPDVLVIEARVRVVSGTASMQGRAAASIVFVTLPNIGGFFNLATDRIFLNDADSWFGSEEGPSASVPTGDDFHTYRIECLGREAGSTVLVYRDGVLALTGHTYSGASDFGAAPRISWGEVSSYAVGTSEWLSFSHNALALPPSDTCPPLSVRVSEIELCWPTVEGQVYQVEQKAALSGEDWTPLPTGEIVGNGSTICIAATLEVGQPARYYRLRCLR
ncbi:MAG: hypothetical protein H7A47_15220 [Verrucomicrobiales bacterium]|nr:hypothetical protein [Verrucomicrobiales bacterium]